MSVAKIQALITGALYLLMGVIANIIGLKNPELIMGVGIQLGINALITYTLAGLIGGFVIGALIAYLYNLLAPRIGGIQIELR
jgi:hypothetical protein